MKKALCNGVRINYQMIGEGSDVVLLHGLAANHAFWRLNVLMTLAKHHRLTVFDLRGHGYSDMPERGYTTADMVGDLVALCDHLGIEKAHLVGHSLGGCVALHYAFSHPERVASLTIADARIRALQPDNFARNWPEWGTARIKLEAAGLRIPDDDPEAGIWLLEQIASPAWQEMKDTFKDTPLFAPFFGASGGSKAAERWIDLLKTTTARNDFTSPGGLTCENLATIRQPLLAVYGELSSALPSLRGLLDLISGCRHVIIPGAGHFFPLTAPARFLDALSPFLAEQEEVSVCQEQ